MAWVYANTGEDYVGETHTLGGTVYSGKTRTPESRRLIEVPSNSIKELRKIVPDIVTSEELLGIDVKPKKKSTPKQSAKKAITRGKSK